MKAVLSLMVLLGCSLFTLVHANGPSPSMLANNCLTCHGPAGNSLGPATPSIAGLSRDYLLGTLVAYKYGDKPGTAETVVANHPGLDNIQAYRRNPTIMDRIAGGYTLAQLKKLADLFSQQRYRPHAQASNAALANKGKKLHKARCARCHEQQGRLAEDDAGWLAGQWQPYLRAALLDYRDGQRAMPEGMRKAFDAMSKPEDGDAIKALVNYYASLGE